MVTASCARTSGARRSRTRGRPAARKRSGTREPLRRSLGEAPEDLITHGATLPRPPSRGAAGQ
eukprot:11195542-Alexandrium_andersonii.AAC.1